MVAVGFILTAATLYFGVENAAGLSPSAATQTGAQSLAMAWPSFEWLALCLLPIVAAPAIPSDRQFGVLEILRSLPLTGGVYLIGKVLGTVVAVLGTGLLVLAIHIVLHLIVIGSPQVDLYLELTFFSGLPIVLWATAVGVLVGTGLRTRLTAILAGIPVAIAGIFIWNIPNWFSLVTGRLLAEQNAHLTYQPISTFILGQHGLLYVPMNPNAGSQALQSIIIPFLVLLGVTIAARLWLLWKEDF
jgi:ABC-type transport system involved in multi-copper enzyme maturation permease subunit